MLRRQIKSQPDTFQTFYSRNLDLGTTTGSSMHSDIPLAGTLSKYCESVSCLEDCSNEVVEDCFNILSSGNLQTRPRSYQRIFNSAPKLNRTTSTITQSGINFPMHYSSYVRPKSCVFVTPTIMREVKSISDFRGIRQSNVQEDVFCQVLPVGPLAIGECTSEENFATIPRSPIIVCNGEKNSNTFEKIVGDSSISNRFDDISKVISKKQLTIKQKVNVKKSNKFMQRLSNIVKIFRSKKGIKVEKKIEERKQVKAEICRKPILKDNDENGKELDDKAIESFFRQESHQSNNTDDRQKIKNNYPPTVQPNISERCNRENIFENNMVKRLINKQECLVIKEENLVSKHIYLL